MNSNNLKQKEKDDFCKKMGLGLKMLIQQESKKGMRKTGSREKKTAKTKASIIKKGITKGRAKEDKIKRRERERKQERRRSNLIVPPKKESEVSFKLSKKFHDDTTEDNSGIRGSHEPLNERIQRLIESVSGDHKPEQGLRDPIKELEEAHIITPKVLPRFEDQFEKLPDPTQREKYKEEEKGKAEQGILQSLFKESPEDFLSMFENLQEPIGKSLEDKKTVLDTVQGLEVVPEDDENLAEMEAVEKDKDPFIILEQKVAAKLSMKLNKLKEKRNSYEYKMEKLKREGREYISRKHGINREPVLGDKKGRNNT
jgi:hypothetical protein